MDATTVAVDLAKEVFEVAMANGAGRILSRKRLTRRQFDALVEELPGGTRVVMEACGTAHYGGRRCQARGHDVQLLPVQYVKPYVRRDKDRPARCRRVTRSFTMWRYPPGTGQDTGAAGAASASSGQWQRTRTARLNTLRGMLREHGVPLALGAHTVLSRLPAILEDADNGLPAGLCHALALVYDEVRSLDRGIKDIDRRLARVAAANPVAQRLLTIPGIGIVTATALLGAVAHIHAFRRARQFASWLGLTPSERSSGFRRRWGGISKRGDVYLRCLLTHGARAVLLTAQRTLRATRQGMRLQHWAAAVAARCGHNKAAIAVANKLARVVWAVWRSDRDFSDGLLTPVAA